MARAFDRTTLARPTPAPKRTELQNRGAGRTVGGPILPAMPRVVLFSADPAPRLDRVSDLARTWSAARLSIVLVSLSPVAAVHRVDPEQPWPSSPDAAGTWTLRLHAYDGQDAGVDPSRRLRELVESDPSLVPLLEGADAFSALDDSGLRTAFHLARRHRPSIASNGLGPALDELDAGRYGDAAALTPGA